MAFDKKQKSLLPAYNIFFSGNALKPLVINKDLSVIVSKPQKAPFAFDSLVLSLDAKLKDDAAILLQAAVKTEKGWSGLYKLAYISKDYKKTFNAVSDDYAGTDTDTVFPKGKTISFKYQITILGKAKINMLCAALTNSEAFYDPELAEETLDLKDFELELEPLSQREFADKKLSAKICSPTSLSMVLNYYGKKVNLADTIKGVYDQNSKLYGVWPLNTAYASQLGLKAFAVKCCSLAQAEGEIYKGRPLIVSVAYKKGELKNAPAQSTKGHVVVVAGFDKKGDVIVYDPAAKTAKEVRRIYIRKQFARAWLKNKKGAAYATED